MCTSYHLIICQKKTCCLHGFYSYHDNLKIPAITRGFLGNDLSDSNNLLRVRLLTDINPESAPAANLRAPLSCGVHLAASMRLLSLTSHIFAPHLSVLCFPSPISLTASASNDFPSKRPLKWQLLLSRRSSSFAHAVTLGHRSRLYD